MATKQHLIHHWGERDPNCVLTTDSLSLEAITSLIRGEKLLLRVKNFYPKELSDELSQRMLEYPLLARYRMGQDVAVQRIGMTLFETENKPEHVEKYYSEAPETTARLREICKPYACPLDLLRLQLEDLWPSGALTENLVGRKMLAGIARMFEADAQEGLPPHQDVLQRDTTVSPRVFELICQLAANIYLKTAPIGGELLIWDASPTLEEFESLRAGRHDFIDIEKLPAPAAVVRPENGELILMRSDYIHAVQPSKGGSRVAMSCFIGYYGDDRPLTYWA